jgi:AraC-like DNA-binding protein
MEEIVFVKNMVCQRCVQAVENSLFGNQIPFKKVELGEVHFTELPNPEKFKNWVASITALGFELIDNKRSRIAAQIKTHLINLVHYRDKDQAVPNVNLSVWLSNEMGMDYSYLSNLFSSIEQVTIEKFYILQKIEKVKEQLVYDELSLSQIADELGYSSVQHLSNQFKKVTGFSTTHFKQVRTEKRKALDEVGR